ncbi:MAG TPA: PEP-CTERM sorting domain-containing protein [Burkholderiaceae bacterium]
MRSLRSLATVSALALLATLGSAAQAAGINVQFSRDPGLQQTGAAFVGQAGDHWNDFLGNAGGGALLDTAGAATGVSLSFSAALVYESDPGYTKFTGTPYANLMQGYLVDFMDSPGIDLKFSGLTPGQEYGFWVYTQGDNNSGNRRISLSANGGTAVVNHQADDDVFVAGHNLAYIVSYANAFGVVDLVGRDIYGEANINGVQFMPVPEPTTAPLLVAGVLFVAGTLLRRRGR